MLVNQFEEPSSSMLLAHPLKKLINLQSSFSFKITHRDPAPIETAGLDLSPLYLTQIKAGTGVELERTSTRPAPRPAGRAVGGVRVVDRDERLR